MAKKQKKKFTVIAKLSVMDNPEIIDAFEAETCPFNAAKIRTYHHIRELAMQGIKFNSREQEKWNKQLRSDFHILKRTATSIIYEAKTIWEMRRASLKAQLEADRTKRNSLICEIGELEAKKLNAIEILQGKKPLKKGKKESEEEYAVRTKERFEKTADEQRNRRSKLVSLKKRLNRLNERIKKEEEILETNNIPICFGTKKLQAEDPDGFREHRDHQMSFTGDADDRAQNGIFQLFFSKSRNQFDIRMRKDFYELPEGQKSAGEEDYAHGRVHFNYGKRQILQALKSGQTPLSYRIIRNDGEYYLYCIFEWTKEGRPNKERQPDIRRKEDQAILAAVHKTQNRNPACIGVDINKGFLSVSIINHYGCLIHTFDLDYRFSGGNRTENDLAYLVSRISYLAKTLNVPVAFEDIDLTSKKNRSRRKGNRALNHMLHSFAYRKYKSLMENSCIREGVPYFRVDPAWTSETARRKYCIGMKLCVHNGAAWIIARKGMGIQDKLPEEIDKKDKALLFTSGTRQSQTGVIPGLTDDIETF